MEGTPTFQLQFSSTHYDKHHQSFCLTIIKYWIIWTLHHISIVIPTQRSSKKIRKRKNCVSFQMEQPVNRNLLSREEKITETASIDEEGFADAEEEIKTPTGWKTPFSGKSKNWITCTRKEKQHLEVLPTWKRRAAYPTKS